MSKKVCPRKSSVRPVAAGLLGVALLSVPAMRAQTMTPDAQVEANVLRSLAKAPELADQSIKMTTIYGVVTLTGSVQTEEQRSLAERLAASAAGVSKVVDQLHLDPLKTALDTQQTANGVTPDAQPKSSANQVLLSDGSYGPAPQDAIGQEALPEIPKPGDAADASRASGKPAAPAASTDPQLNRRPARPPYMQQPAYGAYPNAQYEGQAAGQPVLIPIRALVRVRLNHPLSSNRSQPGSVFDGVVISDITAQGVVAIPRGSAIQGRVIDAKSSGVLKGRGEMSIELTDVTLAGQHYPIVSDRWEHHGGDKTIETVDKTAGFGAAGAVLGALGGGGVGAAVGGGIGAAIGLGSSVASGNGQVFIPAEAVVVFHIAQPASVVTVSQAEMQRLAYGAGPAAEQRFIRRRNYPNVYLGPGYYAYPRISAYPPPPYGYPPY